jgi:hypothetical protein
MITETNGLKNMVEPAIMIPGVWRVSIDHIDTVLG